LTENSLSNGLLHHTIIKFIIDHGYAPDVSELADALKTSHKEITAGLMALQDYHGVVLHPSSTKIWVIHPFSLAPTNFVVRAADREWWGNCAWCSLGVAALLNRDVSISTTLGADRQHVEVHIRDGQVVETDYVVHFPIPMVNAWDNVIYTCSTMLLFENEAEVDRWSAQHRIPKGDVQPIQKIWEFSKVWYGNHLNPDWHKWSTAEAQQIFDRFGLDHTIWKLPVTDASRF
jgi:hypothetical protein